MQAAFIHRLFSQRVRKKLLDDPAFRERFVMDPLTFRQQEHGETLI